MLIHSIIIKNLYDGLLTPGRSTFHKKLEGNFEIHDGETHEKLNMSERTRIHAHRAGLPQKRRQPCHDSQDLVLGGVADQNA